MATCFGIAVSASPQGETKKETAIVAPAKATVTVSVLADGETRSVETTASTVGELLKEQNLLVGKLDRVSVPLSTTLTPDMAPLVITRIRVETVKQRMVIPFATKKKFSARLAYGQTKVVTPGVSGERVKTFHVTYKDGVETTRTKIAEFSKAPKTAMVLAGTKGMRFESALASRGYFGGGRVLQMVATGYGPGDNGRWGARTASGLRPGRGVVAVDPRFIPLGTRLYVEGYGYAVAGDTGGAIKGNRIDLGCDSYGEAMNVGRRRVRVLVLN